MACTDIIKEAIEAQELLIENQLWSIERLAQYLDVPEATIRDWVYKRRVPFVKVGRHVRFKPSDVDEWIEQGGICVDL
jgi:excisionase family DNA binding protein